MRSIICDCCKCTIIGREVKAEFDGSEYVKKYDLCKDCAKFIIGNIEGHP